MRYILNDAGEPVPEPDLVVWAEWFQDNLEGRRVDRTVIDDRVTVSTVFLGLNHQYGDGQPLLFETMIFGGDHDQWQERYSTRAEAVAGHERAVTLARGEGEA